MHRRHGQDQAPKGQQHGAGHGPQARPASLTTRSDPTRPRDIDLTDDDAGPSLAAALSASVSPGSALNAKVLVLNRLYVAIRVVSAKRAFCLLMRDIAEVIHVEQALEAPPGAGAIGGEGGTIIDPNGGTRFINYDFATWADMAGLQRELERDRHDWVRTPRFEIAVPRIIRLLGYDRLPAQTVKLNRRNLFARDRNQCQYCGRTFPTSDLSIDHVLPRAQGGGDSWENLVCACIKCNARKGGRTPEQARMSMVRRAERPRRNPVISLRLGNEKYRSWKTFLDHAYWDVELR